MNKFECRSSILFLKMSVEEEYLDGDEESQDDYSVQLNVDDFDIEGVKIRQGPILPKSISNLEGLDENEIADALRALSDADLEDLFNKNTESFQCLAQVLISRSSLLRHILFHFPELQDPGIDEAFNYVEQEIVFDNVGIDKYRSLCKELKIAPITRVTNSLRTDTLNLKYYGITHDQWRVLTNSIMLNTHLKYVIFQDNWISPTSAFHVGEMLRENNSIEVLNLRECRLGPYGMQKCVEGFSLNQSIKEIDLSYNELGDEGTITFIEGIKDNLIIQKINLGHNMIGEKACKQLGELLKDSNIDYLNLSWNDLYAGKALKYLCDGFSGSRCLKYLNLSWNGISKAEHMGPIVKYLKASDVIEHLDLSFNRIQDKLIRMITAGLNGNNSLISINLGFNLITPDDAMMLVTTLKPEKSLEYMDLQNVFVEKNFIPVWEKLTSIGKKVRIEGVLNNYKIKGPDKKKVLFDRCRFLTQKSKKKQKVDFGTAFIWNLPEEMIEIDALKKLLKKSKIKLDADLIDMLANTFTAKKGKIDLQLMRTTYLDMYPDTEPAPPPKKKPKKGKGKGKQTKSEEEQSPRPTTEEKAIGTDSSVLQKSSLITTKINIENKGSSKKKSESHQVEPNEPESLVKSVSLGE